MGDTRRTGSYAPPPGGWSSGASIGMPPRSIHINELRTAIGSELEQRLVGYSFTYASVGIGATVRAKHINELRAACEAAKTSTWCATDTSVIPAWNNNSGESGAGFRVSEDVTRIRAIHITELRTAMESLSGACMCNCHGYCCNCNGYCACNCVGHCNCQSHWIW